MSKDCFICMESDGTNVNNCTCKNVYVHNGCFNDYVKNHNGSYLCPHCRKKYPVSLKTTYECDPIHCKEVICGCLRVTFLDKLIRLLFALNILFIVGSAITFGWSINIYIAAVKSLTSLESNLFLVYIIIIYPFMIFHYVFTGGKHHINPISYKIKIINDFNQILVNLHNILLDHIPYKLVDPILNAPVENLKRFVLPIVLEFLMISSLLGGTIYTIVQYHLTSEYYIYESGIIGLSGMAPIVLCYYILPLITITVIILCTMIYGLIYLIIWIGDCCTKCCICFGSSCFGICFTKQIHYDINGIENKV